MFLAGQSSYLSDYEHAYCYRDMFSDSVSSYIGCHVATWLVHYSFPPTPGINSC